MFVEGKPRTVFFFQTLCLRHLLQRLKNHNILAWRTWSWVSSELENVKWLLQPCLELCRYLSQAAIWRGEAGFTLNSILILLIYYLGRYSTMWSRTRRGEGGRLWNSHTFTISGDKFTRRYILRKVKSVFIKAKNKTWKLARAFHIHIDLLRLKSLWM